MVHSTNFPCVIMQLCNVLFTRELQKRLDANPETKSIVVNSFSPGLIVSTGLFRDQNPVFTKVGTLGGQHVMPPLLHTLTMFCLGLRHCGNERLQGGRNAFLWGWSADLHDERRYARQILHQPTGISKVWRRSLWQPIYHFKR